MNWLVFFPVNLVGVVSCTGHVFTEQVDLSPGICLFHCVLHDLPCAVRQGICFLTVYILTDRYTVSRHLQSHCVCCD